MQAAKKAKPQQFKLSTQTGRMGLLMGISAGTVDKEELEAAIIEDSTPRPHQKPVVVPWHTGGEVRFPSVTAAATYLFTAEQAKVRQSYAPADYARKINNIKQRIARYCNADNVPHYYWAE
jgi:hypothetical protein